MKIFNHMGHQIWHIIKQLASIINRNLFTVIVILPVLLTLVYLLAFSHDRFISTSQVAVKNTDNAASSGLNIGLLLGGGSSNSTQDAFYLKNYIQSANMLAAVHQQLDLKKGFADSGLDIINALPWRDSKEAFLRYFQERVHIEFEDKTGLLHIETEGFNPQFALQLNQAILHESERFINELSHKIVREQMDFAEKQVQEAFIKLNKSKEAVLAYQNKYGVLDPLAQAEAASKVVVEMQAQKVQLETQLNNQLTFLKADTPQVVTTRNTLKSLNEQIDKEQQKIASPQGVQLNSLAAQFQLLKGQLEFDTKLYSTALVSAESTRIEAIRKVKVLSIIIAPDQAEEAEYPHYLYVLLSILVGSLLLFGTLRLLIAVVEDHRD